MNQLKIEKSTYIQKLVEDLIKIGIKVQLTDGALYNIIVEYKKEIKKISHLIFYRYFGISQILVADKKDPKKERYVRFTDEQYYQIFIKSLIFTIFEIEK